MSSVSLDPIRGPREGMIKPEVTARDTVHAQLRRLVPTRDDLVDLGFAGALTLVALVGFRTGFFGPPWVVAAGSGLVLGLAVAHLSASFRIPAAGTLVLLAVVHFALGGPLAVRDHLRLGVLPGVRTLKELALTPVTGWKEWLTMLAPVDAAGHLLTLPWVTGLAGAALTYAVARRFTSPVVVVLAPLALVVGTILLGTAQPAARLVQGVLAGLLLIGWMVARTHRNRPPLQNGAGRRSRVALGAALLLLAGAAGWVAGPHLPGGDPVAEREFVRAHLDPPFDVAEFTSPLAGFRKYTEPNPAELYDTVILRVSGLPAGTPLRFATLDYYDGSVWGAGDRAEAGTPEPGRAFQQVGSRVATTAPGDPVDVTVSVPDGGYQDVWLPTAGTVTGVRFDGSDRDRLAENLWLNIDTNTAVVPGRLRAGDRYTVSAVVPRPPATTLPDDLAVAGGSVTDDAYSAFLDAKVDAWSGDAAGPWQRLVSVAEHMSGQGAYTDGGTQNPNERYYLPGHSQGRLGRFAGANQLAGNDEQYAATLALIGNRLGVPTRVVMGALPEGDVVKGKDVHAWVEVELAGGQWYPLLPRTFLPDRNKKPQEQQVQQPKQKAGAQVPPPSGANPPSILQGPDQAQNATNIKKIKKSALDPSTWPWWLRLLVLYVLLPLAVLGALYGLVVLLKSLRRRRHARTGPTPRRIALVWADLVADARADGVALPRRATRLEEAAAVPAVPALAALAATANAHVFGPGEPTEEQAEAFWVAAGETRAELRREIPWWRRVLADGDPRPLFGRPGPRPAGAGTLRVGRPSLRRATS